MSLRAHALRTDSSMLVEEIQSLSFVEIEKFFSDYNRLSLFFYDAGLITENELIVSKFMH